MRILELPGVIADNVLVTWLDMASVCRLDSAFCKHSMRTEFLDLLRTNALAMNVIPFKSLYKLSNLYAWSISRSWKTKQIWADPRYVLMCTLSQYLQCTGDKVEFCHLYNVKSKDFEAYSAAVAEHCLHITSLQLAGCSVIGSLRNLLGPRGDLLTGLVLIECSHVGNTYLLNVQCPNLKVLSLPNGNYFDELVASALSMSTSIEKRTTGGNALVTDATVCTGVS